MTPADIFRPASPPPDRLNPDPIPGCLIVVAFGVAVGVGLSWLIFW